MKKLCLAFYFTCDKLRWYLIKSLVFIISKIDLVKYMFLRPTILERIGKWSLALIEFNLKYILNRAIKGQVLANFLIDHPYFEVKGDYKEIVNLCKVNLPTWKMWFDGSLWSLHLALKWWLSHIIGKRYVYPSSMTLPALIIKLSIRPWSLCYKSW